MPDTIVAAAAHQRSVIPRRRGRQPKGPSEQMRVREMLSYLAAALPGGTSAGARLVALQCALRMNVTAEVRLSAGLLRSLRLGNDPAPWRELEQARLLYRIPDSIGTTVVARLLDAALLAQSPARPDRLRAADWALRAARPARVGAIGSIPQLATVYLTAHTNPDVDHGLSEMDRMAYDCGLTSTVLPGVLDQLVAIGSVKSWDWSPGSGDLSWTLTG
ncbi:hypothetical protein [Streptomyces scabichelini]|uniref:hypothetical protein n=1 Tax=Streptomyces scabichelini TaxID=2711217 RepID=UPI001F4981E3|nr:hypothetical protein [Streptomyces scabichelini]